MFRFLMAGISILTSRIIKPTHKPKAKVLADTYPSEFLHAIGRLKDATLRARMRELFDKHSDDLKFFSLYAWVLGQLRASEQQAALKAYVENLR
jgi:hypothetical protein